MVNEILWQLVRFLTNQSSRHSEKQRGEKAEEEQEEEEEEVQTLDKAELSVR